MIMVTVVRDYPSAKIYAKIANSEDKGKCNRVAPMARSEASTTSRMEACSLAVEAPVV